MEGVPPSFMDDDANHLDFQALEDNFNMSELPSLPPEEVPVNQSSMLCNDQAGQNMLVDNNDSIQQTTQFPTSFPQTMTAMGGLDGTSSSAGQNMLVDDNVINDSFQQTTQFPPSFPQTMMEGVPPSFMEDDANQLDFETFNMSELLWSPPEEVPVNQSSMLCNDQAGRNDNDFLYYSSGHSPYQLDQALITPNPYGPQCPAMLPEPSQTLRSPQFPPHNLQVSGDHNQGQVDQASMIPHIENMQQESLMPLNFDRSTRLQNSFIHQPQLGHVYVTPNATTSQHGGFNQPAPRIQCIANQGQVDQADMIPNMDNMQQENFVPRNLGKSTRSQMENLQVRGLQNQTARPNASNPGPDSSLQSQNRGLNTQQEQNIENENMGGDIGRVQREDQVVEAREGEERISSYEVARNNIVSMTGMRAQEDRVSEGALESKLVTEPVDRALEQSNLAGTAGRTQVGVQGTEQGAGEERIQLHSQAENAMEDTVEGSFRHDAFQTIRRTEQVQHLERRSSCERQSINQADEPQGDSSQPSDPLCLDYGRYYDQPFAPSVSNDVIMNDVQNMVRARTEPVEDHDVANSGRLVQPAAGARSSESLKLKDSGTRDMEVFKLLRFSYDRLDDSALQKCLQYCALFPEDHWIEREELIGYLIDEGIIKGMGRRQDAFDEGHTMLNRLQNVCLLESATGFGCKYVKMHDLIRDMAIQIMQENSEVIVKAGAQLEEMPDVEEWTENLTRVSLMRNSFEEILPSHSPMCPNLSTLFLRDNEKLRLIADSFFKEFRGLKVLDLSNTNIQKLPESISDLVSLTALLLTDCEMLRDVPSLKKLMALKRLDLFRTKLEKMPQGMECLTNLRCLRMNACCEMEFPSGILPKLSHLQVLALDVFLITVKGKEVGP